MCRVLFAYYYVIKILEFNVSCGDMFSCCHELKKNK